MEIFRRGEIINSVDSVLNWCIRFWNSFRGAGRILAPDTFVSIVTPLLKWHWIMCKLVGQLWALVGKTPPPPPDYMYKKFPELCPSCWVWNAHWPHVCSVGRHNICRIIDPPWAWWSSSVSWKQWELCCAALWHKRERERERARSNGDTHSGDYSVGKLSAMGRPTQPSIPFHPCNCMDYGEVETIIPQTGAACGCGVQSPCVGVGLGWTLASVCDAQPRCSLFRWLVDVVVIYKCQLHLYLTLQYQLMLICTYRDRSGTQHCRISGPENGVLCVPAYFKPWL